MNTKKYITNPYILEVIGYFSANPGAELLNNDIKSKFGKAPNRSIYEELRPAVKDGLLKTRKEGFSLLYSIGDESLLDALLTTSSLTQTHGIRPMIYSDSSPQPLDPSTMIALGAGHYSLLTKSRTKNLSSRADLAPQALRPGCEQADNCPSRIGNELHYPNGKKATL